MEGFNLTGFPVFSGDRKGVNIMAAKKKAAAKKPAAKKTAKKTAKKK